MNYKPTQGVRLFIAFFYVLILLVTSKYLFGSIFPPIAGKGLWFYAGLSSLILNSQLITPFYTKPADSITFSVTAIIGISLVSDWSKWEELEVATFLICLSIPIFVLFISVLAIVLKDSSGEFVSKIGRSSSFLSSSFGDAKIIFSCVFLFAVIVYHIENPKEILVLFIIWSLVVLIRPEESFYKIVGALIDIWSKKISERVIGNIIAYQTPNVVLIEQFDFHKNSFGKGLYINDKRSPFKVAFTVGYIGYQDKLLLKAVSIDSYCDLVKVNKFSPRLTPNQTAVGLGEALYQSFSDDDHIEKMKETFVGLISENSNTSIIQFHVLTESEIEEGRLVEARIRNKDVLFQVIEGLTKEEIIRDKNRFGFCIAKAKKLGSWNYEKRRFDKVSWVPEMNSPVFLSEEKEAQLDVDTIGHFPRSEFTVQINDLDKLITHNTAILGILGIGKSMLSIELVERMIAEKKKVICIDLTDQYSDELSVFYDVKSESKMINKLKQAVANGGKNNVQRNVEEGGGVSGFTKELEDQLRVFIDPRNNSYLKIYNPTDFEVWRQSGGVYNNQAAMASLTPTELTQLISETVLRICQEMGMSKKARVCLVYEEAHSLIPEWNSVATEGDKAATNATSRAILQGRKFGLGCLLITQRTANVTKTILNQCNSIFAMRTFDDTGKAFLANYIGQEYSDMLSSLKERQAVFYGRSSSCEDPVLIRLNDRDDFTTVFREKFPIPDFPDEEIEVTTNNLIIENDQINDTTVPEETNTNAEETSEINPFDEMDDDLPF